MEALFCGSEVRELGRPLAACSLEAHAFPQVGWIFGPSLYAGASLQICEWLLKQTTFWASYLPHTFLLASMK